ncbi:hypothetical protein [Xanthobacter agilis]|uniref:Uncharacterized protein n=1 Tax=Xanthobacter agilis TaxID=47492 RepID=A0ABU0LF91_XANAG|nr:hypothetical protein [Xanthobacter agilis]MDQ0505809.1 hypothetical protein [Xanthobacter agilis]
MKTISTSANLFHRHGRRLQHAELTVFRLDRHSTVAPINRAASTRAVRIDVWVNEGGAGGDVGR